MPFPRTPRKLSRLLPCFALAASLLAASPAAAYEGAKTFVVPAGQLSDGLRKLVEGYGWSLAWDANEDRRVEHPFDVADPSLEGGLANVLSAYRGAFVSSLDQERKTVRVTSAGVEPVFEAAPAVGGDEKPTVRMLDLPPSRESREPPPAKPMPETVARLDLSEAPSARKQASKAPKAPGPARPVVQLLSMQDRAKAEKERSRLQALGHDVYLEEFRQGEALWHRLKMRLAPGQGVGEAKAKLKGLGYGDVWVVPQDSVGKQRSVDE